MGNPKAPIKWQAGRYYYEVEVVELGGVGRGVMSPDRNPTSEGGQLTVGWATADFTGEAHAYKGVGDDRHSWGLRAADPRGWNKWHVDSVRNCLGKRMSEKEQSCCDPFSRKKTRLHFETFISLILNRCVTLNNTSKIKNETSAYNNKQ